MAPLEGAEAGDKYALTELKLTTLYSAYNAYNYVANEVVCTSTFACTCWAPNKARGSNGKPSQDCSGHINFVATHCPGAGEDVHQVHFAVVHP